MWARRPSGFVAGSKPQTVPNSDPSGQTIGVPT